MESLLFTEIIIENNQGLPNLIGLDKLTNGSLSIRKNPSLQSLDGLDSISTLFRIFIRNNAVLDDISFLNGVDFEIDDLGLSIYNNPNLSIRNITPIVWAIIKTHLSKLKVEIEK